MSLSNDYFNIQIYKRYKIKQPAKNVNLMFNLQISVESAKDQIPKT